MNRKLGRLVLAATCCAACSVAPQQHPPSGAPAESAFAPAPCAFPVPEGAQVRCGWLTAPEDRSRSRGRVVKLHVAIYASRKTPAAPDPILWLVGGPGGRAHALSSTLYSRVIAPYLDGRDFIVLDVRGTGYSTPALDCPDTSGPPEKWVPACRDALRKKADLSAYNGAAVAADLADLRRALGVREWNLMGESYGTRLALQAMRDQPEGIRSAILDSVSPPEVDTYADGPARFEAASDALFSDCAADAACNAAFPNLRAALLRAADRLDAAPRRLQGDWHGVPLDIRLDGRQLIEALHMALYESDLIPELPKAIAHALDGKSDGVWREAVARHAVFVARRIVDQGAYLSYHCVEETPFADRARLAAEDAKRPWQRHVAAGLAMVDACRVWGVRAAGVRESLPVVSSIPTLLLSGRYDPVTPPTYAASAASRLARSFAVVFPDMGHWLTANPVSRCPQTLALQFLENPNLRPSDPCLAAAKVRWVVR